MKERMGVGTLYDWNYAFYLITLQMYLVDIREITERITGKEALALQMIDPGLIPGKQYGPWAQEWSLCRVKY